MVSELAPVARTEALAWLWGARVQRVDGPAPGLFAFTLYDHGQKPVLLISLQPRRRGLGIVATRPTGQPASAFVQRLRGVAENARLDAAHWLASSQDGISAAALELCFARKDASLTLVVDFDARAPNLFLLDAAGLITGAADERARHVRFPERASPYTATRHGRIDRLLSPEQAERAGRALRAEEREQGAHDTRAHAKTLAASALRRARRKVEAIRADLARAEAGPQLRREANLLLCNLREVPVGASQARLLDQSVEPAEWLDVPLDPALSAQHNAERKFVRARRLERGIAIASARLATASAEADALAALVDVIDTAAPEVLAARAGALGLRLEAAEGGPSQPRARKTGARVPYRSFEGSGGALILVGKGAADNDALTLNVARPHDLWLHARGVQGAHVVVPSDRNREPAPELLLDAAHLAAHFSAARGEPLTEVQHTERRYVRKPKGAPPGSVRVDRERVLLLRLEPERLRRLLAAEKQRA
jgi:predicted ribosome quality control (RQC) complex YloA/Tae2 family protein